MFDFTLENGKRQFKTGLISLLIAILMGVALSLLLLIPNQTAQLVITILFSIGIGITGTFALIGIIFGAVVYHAERTSSRGFAKKIDNLDSKVEKYEIVDYKYNKDTQKLLCSSKSGKVWVLKNITEKDYSKFQKLSKKEKIEWVANRI